MLEVLPVGLCSLLHLAGFSLPMWRGLLVFRPAYLRVLANGILFDDESFDMLMERCVLIEAPFNEKKA